MNKRSKQRIVGAFVLLALALIFFPLMFDFSEERRVDKTSIIPPQPDIQPAVIPEPERPVGIVPAPADEEIFTVSEEDVASPADLEPEPPGLDEQGIPLAWVVQVASFKERGKAEDMVARLQQDNHKSFLQRATTTAGVTYRVLVGPNIRKQDALNEKRRIDSRYGSDALVLRFKP